METETKSGDNNGAQKHSQQDREKGQRKIATAEKRNKQNRSIDANVARPKNEKVSEKRPPNGTERNRTDSN